MKSDIILLFINKNIILKYIENVKDNDVKKGHYMNNKMINSNAFVMARKFYHAYYINFLFISTFILIRFH